MLLTIERGDSVSLEVEEYYNTQGKCNNIKININTKYEGLTKELTKDEVKDLADCLLTWLKGTH